MKSSRCGVFFKQNGLEEKKGKERMGELESGVNIEDQEESATEAGFWKWQLQHV